MCSIFVYQSFKSFWRINITGCVIQSRHQHLAERGLGQLTDKTKKKRTATRLKPRFKYHGYSHCPTLSNRIYKEKDERGH